MGCIFFPYKCTLSGPLGYSGSPLAWFNSITSMMSMGKEGDTGRRLRKSSCSVISYVGLRFLPHWRLVQQVVIKGQHLGPEGELALFDMPNLNRFDILSISIFCKIALSISISISIFSKITISISISISIFLELP